MIVLRAGIGTDARSRRAVAERLGVGVDRVRRAERSGLRGLREADSDFGCASGSACSGPGGANGTGGVGLAIASGGAGADPAGPVQLASSSVADGAAAAPDRNEVGGVSESSDDAGSGSGSGSGSGAADSVRRVASPAPPTRGSRCSCWS